MLYTEIIKLLDENININTPVEKIIYFQEEFKNHERRCPRCQISKGERRIMAWLDLNNIEYVYNEEYFNDLFGNTSLLRPDFILPNYKIWIEYDGEFHYEKYYEKKRVIP